MNALTGECARGHDLRLFGFVFNSGNRWGCRECRRIAADIRWENQWSDGAPVTIENRFWHYVERTTAHDCWNWRGGHIPSGYGSLGSVEVDGIVRSQVGAHRVAFYVTHGYWPNVARHTCDNPGCVNPAHIIDGTTRDNALDMVERHRSPAQQRTTCPQGHLYDAANTYVTRRGHRKCRACMRESNRRAAVRRMREAPDHVRELARERAARYRSARRVAA